MQFRVLGPVEAFNGDRPVRLGGPQQHALLALLLVHSNQVVSAERLADQLWNEQPPSTFRSLLHGCVAGLRKALPEAGGAALVTRAPGYLLRVPAGAVDAGRFEELARTGEQCPDPARASGLFRQALALWRGPAYDGVSPGACRAEAGRLDELRLTVLQRRIDADLRRGRYDDVVAELQILVRDQPLRESYWLRLMTALHRSGRSADALRAYRELRRTLADELGIEPAGPARNLHRAILAGTGGGTGGSAAVPRPASTSTAGETPAQVPAAVSAFTGRSASLDRLDRLLVAVRYERPGAVAVVCGMAGVGKTTLAVEWAHRRRDQFADGQLYVNLRGFTTGAPVRPIEALTGFLRALGVPAEQVPTLLDQASALFRTLVSKRRLLVLLDNAGSAEQVRPLLPGGDGCLTLVTSRRSLGGLVARDGADHIVLDALDPAEAAALLVRVLGRERTAGREAAVAELARLCAGLPLALRIAAANVTLRPATDLFAYATELGAGSRLSALAVGADDDGSAVRAAFDLSYANLAPPVARLFRLFALVPGSDCTADDAAALAGTDRSTAAGLLARLADAHLIVPLAAGRYSCHDLLRLYAAERIAIDDPPAQRRSAVDRLYGHYLHRAGQAAEVLYPHMLRALPPAGGVPEFDPAASLAWLDAERPNLVRAVSAAAEDGPREAGWLLGDLLRGYFHLSRHTADWLTVGAAALLAAQRTGDQRGQAAALHSLGTANRSIGEHHIALRYYEEALSAARAGGWPESEATTLGNLGIVCRKLGRLEDAGRHLEAALRIDRAIGRRAGEANNLGNLGTVRHEEGRLHDAAESYTAAIALNAATGSRHGEALWLTGLGLVDHDRGRLAEAAGRFGSALDGYRQVGDRDGEATVLCALAVVDCDGGRPGPGRERAVAALSLARETGDRQTEALARNALGYADRLLGRPGPAVEQHLLAYDLAARTAGQRLEGEALIGLALAYRELGDLDGARGAAMRAQTLAARIGMQVIESEAHAALSAIYLSLARIDLGLEHGRLARAIQRRCGNRPSAARIRGLPPGRQRQPVGAAAEADAGAHRMPSGVHLAQ